MKRVRCLLGALLAVLWVAPLGAQQPTGTIRGRITDARTQEPIHGVSVTLGTRGALTQADGRYVLTGVPAGTDSVRARMIGYAPSAQLVTITGGDTVTVDFGLTAQAVGLSEIVVVGYGTQRAGNITGAVKQVTAAEFNPGRNISPQMLIQNKVAGVQVVENNEPGGGISIRVRGPTSVTASSEPLYVIDGVPLGLGAGAAAGLSAGRDPLNFLDPNDIETITVLKDASAAAIYGANAANGVVLIETKTGRGTGRPRFEYSGSTSSSSVTRLPSMLNAAQFRTAVETYAPQNVGQLQNANTDWFSLIDRTAFGQEHNFSVAGAGEANTYHLSLGYLNQKGILRRTTTERLSLGFNYEQGLYDNRLNIRANLRGARDYDQFTPGGVLYNAAQMGPTQPVFSDGSATGYYNWPGNTLQSADNPVEILNLAKDQGTTYRSIGNLLAQYSMPFLDALKANVNLSYDVARADRETFNPNDIHIQTKSGIDGTDYRSNFSQLNTTLESYLNYAAALNVVPGNIDVTAGYSYAQSHSEFPWFLAQGLSSNILGGDGVVAARTVTNFQDIQDSKLISFFGRVNYNFNDRYLASVSLRRDGSSRFGPENEWGTFPAVSLGWRLSQEPFMQGLGFSDLKLRAAWGKTGNQSFANYQQYSRYQASDAQTAVQFGNQFVATIRPSAYNPLIRWEETKSLDLGLDYGFLNQRFTGAIDWYNKKTDGLIFFVPVCAGCNLSNFATRNIGKMKNQGFELSLSARLLERSRNALSWTADFTASHLTNKLLAIYPTGGNTPTQIPTGLVAGGVGTFIQVYQPGVPINSFSVYQHKRDASGRPIYEDNNGLDATGHFTGVPDGTINEQDLYVDRNGDGRINQDDRRPFHDPAPKWILGHTSNLAYRDFELSLTLRAYLGNWVYNNVASNLGTYSEVTRASPYNLHSSVLETGFQTPQYLSDYYVEDASFLRMDNISLAYNFNYQGRPMRAFATMQNAFTITGYNGVDPTAGLGGIDNNLYPRARTFSAGVSVRF